MKKKILVVDDDWAIRELLKERLSAFGFEVYLAQNAQEFCQKALSIQPHLIILDIDLGTQMGTEAYDSLRKQGLDPKLPVIFLTGLANDFSPSPAAEGRTYALHKKPFKAEELLTEIQLLTQEISP